MTTTTNRGYSTPATGTEVDVWGSDDLNPNFEAIDANLGAVASVALTTGTTTLNATQYAKGTIIFSGSTSGTCTVVFPSVQGWWCVSNQTDFSHDVFVGSGGGIIGLPPGEFVTIQINGTNAPSYIGLGDRIGSFMDIAASSVPGWITGSTVPPYLLCDGSSFSSVTYPALAAVLAGTTLPDLRGRSRFFLNGGTGRISSSSGVNGDSLFASGGQSTVTLDTTQIPSHNHGVNDPGHAHLPGQGSGFLTFVGTGGASGTAAGINVGLPSGTASAATGISIQNTGGGGGHTNMPPAFISGICLIRAA